MKRIPYMLIVGDKEMKSHTVSIRSRKNGDEGSTPVAMFVANLIREIRRERRIELFAEGYRWDDVCRWNVGEIVYNRERRGAKMDPALYTKDEIQLIEDEVGFDKDGFITPYTKKSTLTMNFTDKYYLYNIPLNEISLNPNLLPQNPGW